MSRRWIAVLTLVALTACSESEPPVRCECRPSELGRKWPRYNEGVRWHTSLEEACKRARQEGKLVFYYLLVGDMDKELC
jgi:hypothetical protein